MFIGCKIQQNCLCLYQVSTARCTNILLSYHVISGPGSAVGIATGYGLDGLWIDSRWGAKFSAPVQTGPGAHPASCTMGTGSFSGVKSCRGMTLTPHPLLVPWSWKGRAIPLLPLWAVRPVQNLSACTRVHSTFFLPRYLDCVSLQHVSTLKGSSSGSIYDTV